MKKSTLVIVLLIVCALIAIVPLAVIHNSEFGGSDGEAESIISEIAPEYEPWAENILEPPGGETESLLFCLQAGAGAGIVGFGFGWLIARSKYKKES